MENQEKDNQQEVDYKVEYEKVVSEKERDEVLKDFKKAMGEHGYDFNEDDFSANCSKYDNQALKNFEEMFRTLQPRSNRGFKIGAEEQQGQQYIERKATFKDYIDSKKK